VAKDFYRRFGPWALIAGAAEGLGAEFASQLAERGLNLVLVDLDLEKLALLATELRSKFGIEVLPLHHDLADPNAAATIAAATTQCPLALLVYNAADSQIGYFSELDAAKAARVIAVNTSAPVELIRALLPRFRAQGRGAILLVGSNAGLIGHAKTALYGATKAFLVRLGEALAEEVAKDGVHVIVACPGAVQTPNFQRSGAQLWSPLVAKPAEVARAALEALWQPGPVVILGRGNRAAMRLFSLLPRRLAVKLMGRVMRSTYPDRR
jgi:short-subunit dehydrogenase